MNQKNEIGAVVKSSMKIIVDAGKLKDETCKNSVLFSEEGIWWLGSVLLAKLTGNV